MSSLTPMHLPDEILLKIIRRLPLKAVLSMSAVCSASDWLSIEVLPDVYRIRSIVV